MANRTQQQINTYLEQQFMQDCQWRVSVTFNPQTETYTATDLETHAELTAQIGSDDDNFSFTTAMGRVVMQIPFPEDNE
jgi:hypothetical protein